MSFSSRGTFLDARRANETQIFSKSGEALKMVAAGKDVEPVVISTVKAALK